MALREDQVEDCTVEEAFLILPLGLMMKMRDSGTPTSR
jgi:hypothetical protein